MAMEKGVHSHHPCVTNVTHDTATIKGVYDCRKCKNMKIPQNENSSCSPEGKNNYINNESCTYNNKFE